MTATQTSRNWLINALVFFAYSVVIAHVALGAWSYSQGDNLYYSALAKQQGLSALATIYAEWSGRISTYMIGIAIERLGIFPFYTNWLVVLNLMALSFALGWLLCWCFPMIPRGFIAADIAFFYLALPNPVKQQVFYWFDGSIPHLMPIYLSVLAAYLCSLNKLPERCLHLLLAALFLFVGMLSESSTMLMIMLLACLLVFHFRSEDRRSARASVFIILISLIISLLVMAAAPGQESRLILQRQDVEMPTYLELAKASINALVDHVLWFFLAMLAYGISRAYFYLPSNFLTRDMVPPWLCLLLPFIVSAPGIAAVVFVYKGEFNADRILLAPYVVSFICGLLVGCYAVRWLKSHQPGWVQMFCALAIAICIFLPGPGFTALMHSFKQAPAQREETMAQFTAAFKAERSGQKILEVPLVANHGSLLYWEPLMPDANHYLNRLFAAYFQLDHVVAVVPTSPTRQH